ncbi:MAG: hypothetical protein RR710_09290 [Oscillospiraceae bacterium]
MVSVAMASCFGTTGNLLEMPISEEDKTTPEEAVQIALKEEGYSLDKPHAYTVIDDYIFLMYDGVSHTGRNDPNKGYILSLPFGFKMSGMAIDQTIEKVHLDYIGITKNKDDYIIDVSGIKEENEDTSLAIYNNAGEELEKLFIADENKNVIFWIDVVKDKLPDDYAVYAEYNGEKYPLIDAKKIKELVG